MVYALDINDPNNFAPAKFTNIGTVVNLVLPLMTTVAAVAFLALILSAAYQWITSEGKPENLAKAQKTFMYAAIGLIFIISSYFFVKLIARLLNIGGLPL